MEAPSTPTRPHPTSTNGAQHTRPPEQNTPSNLNRNKRRKEADVQPPPFTGFGGKAVSRHCSLATAAINAQLEEESRQGNVRKQVLHDLATTLDGFVSHYSGDHQRSHHQQAKSLVQSFLDHLKVEDFAATGGAFYAPYRLPSTQPTKTNSSGPAKSGNESSSKQVTWAAVAKQGHSSNISGLPDPGEIKRGGKTTGQRRAGGGLRSQESTGGRLRGPQPPNDGRAGLHKDGHRMGP
ncbi:hypothetical protein GQX73_g10963 [Xylaria multiplex]|uniref:Uncharacterized protein n=1 Tax=Xylaria multiplex TaxID=323545 RepID=A0A7C8MHH4_9PEZI|nr:hypothetical protein GQX73_g10963 [Xylaria multiplex]